MKIWKAFIIFIFLFSSKLAMGQQGYMYSYLDPCTSKAKEIYIDTSNGSVPLTYNGQVRSFTDAELQSGAFQTWIDSVNTQNPSGPCSSVGLAQNTNVNVLVAQNSISVITTVMSTLSTMASMQDVATSTSGVADALTSMGGASVQGVIQTDEKVSSNNDKENDNKNGNNNNSVGSTSNNSGNQNSSNSQGNQTSNTTTGGSSGNQGTNNTTSSGPTSTNSQSSQSSVNNNSSTSFGNQNSQNNTQNNQNSPVVSENPSSLGSGGSIITGGINSVRIDNTQQSESDKTKKSDDNKETAEDAVSSGAISSSTTKSKVAAVKKGNLMMNGDLVTIASATGDPSQFKINASIISSNTKNTFAKGALINFTSYVNNSNLTLFVSYRHKKLTSIFANSMMLNFQKDFFDTFSLMESYKYHKVTSTLGVNLTIGNIGTSKFQSLSMLGGVFSSFKLNPKIGLTTMFVTVYSPYVYYYEGMWYQSGILFVPFTSVDYKITKKFKLNISFSAVQQLNDKAISYQILTGAKCLL
jgi:hypothetical protein